MRELKSEELENVQGAVVGIVLRVAAVVLLELLDTDEAR
jgi:hypothetical protein